MIQNSTRMAEIAYHGKEPTHCSNPKCRRIVLLLEPCFFDSLWDRIFCRQCGLCLRYARKKALQRGELIEGVEL